MIKSNLVVRQKKVGMFKRAQRGFTLVEVLMAMSLGSLIMASGARFVNDRVDDIKDQATAQYQKQVTVAAERYIKDNLGPIAGGLAVGGAPVAIPLATLSAANYLSSGIVNSNPYRQTPCIVVRRLADRTNGEKRLEALVTTEGGNSIPDRRVPFVAAQAGSYGGFVPSTAPTTAQGAYGVWSTPIAAFNTTSCSGTPVTANHLAFALFFDGASEGNFNPDDLLYRNVVAGRPDLNTMNTTLNMGGFDLINANNVTATGAVNAGSANITNTVNAGKVVVPGGNNFQVGSSVLYGDAANTAVRQTGGFYVQHADGSSADISQVKDITSSGNINASSGTVSGAFVQGTGDAGYGQTVLHSWGLGNSTGDIYLEPKGGRNLYLTDSWSNTGTLQSTFANNAFTGNVSVTGSATALALQANSSTVTLGNTYNVADTWAFLGYGAGWNGNVAPQSAVGSAYLNDAYFRSAGKWASQLGGYTNFFQVVGPTVGTLATSYATCPAGSRMLSGGYQLISWAGSENAPDVNIPDPGSNSWMISGSGSAATFRPYAMCAN